MKVGYSIYKIDTFSLIVFIIIDLFYKKFTMQASKILSSLFVIFLVAFCNLALAQSGPNLANDVANCIDAQYIPVNGLNGQDSQNGGACNKAGN